MLSRPEYKQGRLRWEVRGVKHTSLRKIKLLFKQVRHQAKQSDKSPQHRANNIEIVDLESRHFVRLTTVPKFPIDNPLPNWKIIYSFLSRSSEQVKPNSIPVK
jgi:hypothetical protein